MYNINLLTGNALKGSEKNYGKYLPVTREPNNVQK